MILLKHMVSEISIILASLLLLSCSNKAPSIDSCNKLYESNQTEHCFNCAKEYLKSHPDDLEGMKSYTRCAQSKQELEEVQLYIKNKFELFEKEINYFLLYASISTRLKEHYDAYASYRVALKLDSTYYDVNYLAANAAFSAWKERTNKDSTIDKLSEQKELGNFLAMTNLELKYHPENKNAQSFKAVLKQASDSLASIYQ